MYAYSRKNGIRHWYAVMERPLARSLLRLNFAFKAIGPQTDYYGPVMPYLADIRELGSASRSAASRASKLASNAGAGNAQEPAGY